MKPRPLTRPSVHWLLAFVPVALWLEHSGASAPLVFCAASLAIIPIAQLIVHSTEKIALHSGDALGGLLNATFGNAPEIIISMVALRAQMYELVLGSLAGALLGNALFATGLAFLLGGLREKTQRYNATNARLLSSMMLVSVVSLMVPSAFYRTFHDKIDPKQTVILNIWLACLFLAVYALYLVFTLYTHKDLFAAITKSGVTKEDKPSLPRAVVALTIASVLAAVMSEALVGAAEETGEALGLSQVFIGVVVLALVGGAAEIFSAVAVARKDRMDMAIGITMGSSVQVVLFITPVLVISSLFMSGPPFLITFGAGTIVAVLLTALMSAMITSDGQSQWFKGVQMLVVYLVIASTMYFIPSLK